VPLTRQKEDLTYKITFANKEINSLNELVKENKLQIVDILSLENDVKGLRQKENESNLFLQEIKKEQIVLEEKLNEIEKCKKLLLEKEKKIESSLNDRKYFEILEKAFSKNGIQIAIIETVVPELEKEANRVLSRLTDNQMHVALRTQREKKSQGGGLAETLDVIIADTSGTRNYELYSGGEAFKIDFSLRLALSRLLTNRSGAKLQTLIIDEGFGSQDTSGKERLVEVIKSIEGEFELILVVTHMDELKDSFPVQIQVIKDDQGSKIKIEG
jgi:exonuclease SbcC